MPDLWGGFPDYYGVLRVAPDASDGELRSAWRVAAKRWHPDTNDGQDAATMMRRVNEAWQVLGDRDARAVYDEVYFAWRTGSEQLAGELSGRLSMQQERRQARATSQEWTRWGREDRGRWGREQRRDAGAREREAGRGREYGSGQSRSAGAGTGNRASAGTGARNQRQQEPRAEAGAGAHAEDVSEDEVSDDKLCVLAFVITVVVGLVVIAVVVIGNQ